MNGDRAFRTRIELATQPCYYQNADGKFHPALFNGHGRLYWPNVTFEHCDPAIEWAERAIKTAYEPLTKITDEWNVWSAS